MKHCKKCGNEFEPVKGIKNYCSISCRNSREWSEADKIKKSISAKNSAKVKNANIINSTNPEKIKKYKLTVKKRQEARLKEILNSPFDELNWADKRVKIYHEQNCKCNLCGNDKWQGEDIPLELEHKDGNPKNNKRDNLELLCPNCHALTPTWRGRNKKGQRPKGHKISDEELLATLLRNNWNMRQSLLEVGLAPKGANYPRCHKIKKLYFE